MEPRLKIFQNNVNVPVQGIVVAGCLGYARIRTKHDSMIVLSIEYANITNFCD